MEILRNLFDIGYVYEQGGVDAAAYAVMAIVGTLLFAIRLTLSLLFGMDGDADFDVEDIDHSGGFGIFSFQSIVAFFMGAGWAGLAARFEWQLQPPAAALVSGGFGFLLMLLSALTMFAMMKFKRDITYDMNDAVGKVGTVYMRIPPKGQGSGQVRISISGRSMIVDAVTESEEKLEAFSDVQVHSVRDDKTLIVGLK